MTNTTRPEPQQIERWTMPSGRVAIVDLSQTPEQIEQARALLRDYGDAEPMTEDPIHPEIPMPSWASERHLDDDGRSITDEHSFDRGMFTVELSRSVTIRSDGPFFHADNVTLWWTNEWPGEDGRDRESMTVFPADIPELIEALQAAHASHGASPRVVRRSAELEEALREREQ